MLIPLTEDLFVIQFDIKNPARTCLLVHCNFVWKSLLDCSRQTGGKIPVPSRGAVGDVYYHEKSPLL